MFHGMESVYTVWKEKSFSAAARKLYVSQPALSNSVKRVEDRLGAPIFDRSTTPLSLTEVGREYIRTVENILALQEDFAQYIADLHELKMGEILIGSSSMLSSYLLPQLIAAFKKIYPQVDFRITVGDTDALKKMLEDGTVDLILRNVPLEDDGFQQTVLFQDHLVLAVPEDWEVNASLRAYRQSRDNIVSGSFLSPRYPFVPLEKFSDRPFILLSEGNDTRVRAEKLCEGRGFRPNCVLTLNQQLSAYNMTCRGLGGSFVSDFLIRGSLPDPKVVYYKLDETGMVRNVSFYTRKGRYVPFSVREFLSRSAQVPEASL